MLLLLVSSLRSYSPTGNIWGLKVPIRHTILWREEVNSHHLVKHYFLKATPSRGRVRLHHTKSSGGENNQYPAGNMKIMGQLLNVQVRMKSKRWGCNLLWRKSRINCFIVDLNPPGNAANFPWRTDRSPSRKLRISGRRSVFALGCSIFTKHKKVMSLTNIIIT